MPIVFYIHTRTQRLSESWLSSCLSVDPCASASTEWLNELSNGTGASGNGYESLVRIFDLVFYGYHVAVQVPDAHFAFYGNKNGRAASVPVDAIPYVSKGTLSVVRDRR